MPRSSPLGKGWAVLLFRVVYSIDREAYRGPLNLPPLDNSEGLYSAGVNRPMAPTARRRAVGWMLAVVMVSVAGIIVLLLESSPTYSPPPALPVVR